MCSSDLNACYIASILGQTVITGLPVLIDSNNKLGTNPSSKRFKENIKPMNKASEAILALKPVTFYYKSDNTNTPQFGLIAEDVAAASPELVVRDKNGKPYAVRYEQVNAMLLNEFLKENKKVQEQQASVASLKSTVAKQEATIAELKSTVAQQQKSFQSKLETQEKQIAALTSGLQKIDVQFELGKPEQQVVFENHKRQVCATP